MPLGVVSARGPTVVARGGTRTVSLVGLTVNRSASLTRVVLKSRVFSMALAPKPVPAMVTIAPALAPGGVTNAIRGPPTVAICVPVNVPSAIACPFLSS